MPLLDLPLDEVLMEQALRTAMTSLLMSVPVALPPHVHDRERFPSNAIEDEALTATDDPVVGDKAKMTNVVEIGPPQIGEVEYTSDTDTQLTFTYPITYSLGVHDTWDSDTFEFTNSGDMFIAFYMRARKLFKLARQLGYKNCVHYFLQQEQAGTVLNDEGEAIEHSASWSLTVSVSGVKR